MFKASILVVEDEDIVALSLQRHLEELGYFVSGVIKSGAEAIASLSGLLPDLILMDIQLRGGMDGVATAEFIKKQFDIPIIYLTGNFDSETIQRAKLTEPFGFIVKPFDTRELETTIEITLYKYEMERRLRENEAQLRATQNRLAKILETAEDAIISIDEAQLIILFNSGAERIFGYSAGEIMNKHFNSLMAEGYRGQTIHDIFRTVTKDNETSSEGKRLRLLGQRKDGEVFPCEGSFSKLILDGETTWTIIVHDTTLRDELEDRLNAIYHFGQELVMIHDEEEILEQVLITAANILRLEIATFGIVNEKRNLIQYKYRFSHGVLDRIEMELDLDGDRGIMAQVVKSGQPMVLADTSPYDRFVQIPGSNLKSAVCVPVRIGGKVYGVLIGGATRRREYTQNDIQLLRSLADQAAVAIENGRLFDAEQYARRTTESIQTTTLSMSQSLDLDTVLTRLLDNIHELIHYDRASILFFEGESQLKFQVTRNFDSSFAAENELEAMHFDVNSTANLKEIVSTGKGFIIPNVKDYPGWLKILESHHEQCCWLGVPLIVGNEIIGICSMEKDETGYFTTAHLELVHLLATPAAIVIKNAFLYRETQEQFYRLKESQYQLIQAEKVGALGRLAASVAHEINNPLQAIHTCVMLMQEDLLENEFASLGRFLDVIEGEINRMVDIVGQMQDFYRPVDNEYQVIDVYDVLTNVLFLTKKKLTNNDIRPRLNWADDLPLIKGNTAHLKQVFLNLIFNAIDAMPQGGELNISIAVWKEPIALEDPTAPQGIVEITFQDTGHGMPPNVRQHLFEPFFTTKENGTGLGLAVSHGIVEAHGGKINVESEEGTGTMFTLLFPRVFAEEQSPV